MELQIGTQYQCRRKEYIACVTDDISQFDKLYQYKGHVVDENTGNSVRKICMWTATGIYNIDHPTDYDIISIVSGSNPDDGFLTQQEATEYVRTREEWWGSNLIGWVEEKDGKFFPCFNVWD